MNNICTSIEQSKILIELGLNPETSDMVYPAWTLSDTPTEDICKIRTHDFESENDVPAWSLSALLELIPHNNFYGVELNNYGDGKVWTAMFQGKNWDQHPIRISDSPLDAVFEMMCWLFENNFFKKGGKDEQSTTMPLASN